MKTKISLCCMAIAISIATILWGSRNANADLWGIYNGNKLESLCDQFEAGKGTYRSGLCAGFVAGTIDTMLRVMVAQGTCTFSLPYDVTVQQTVDIVRKYLHFHPEKRLNSAPSLIVAAMTQAFPCKK